MRSWLKRTNASRCDRIRGLQLVSKKRKWVKDRVWSIDKQYECQNLVVELGQLKNTGKFQIRPWDRNSNQTWLETRQTPLNLCLLNEKKVSPLQHLNFSYFIKKHTRHPYIDDGVGTTRLLTCSPNKLLSVGRILSSDAVKCLDCGGKMWIYKIIHRSIPPSTAQTGCLISISKSCNVRLAGLSHLSY